jgi:hypothetical protein
MAAPTNAAKREESACQPEAVDTWHVPDLTQFPTGVRNAGTKADVRQRLRIYGLPWWVRGNEPRNDAQVVKQAYFPAFIFLNRTLFPSAILVAM